MKHCLICNTKLTGRQRKYCCKKCRTRATNQRTAEAQKEWGRKRRAQYAWGKLQCKICGGWYVQLGSHVVQRHGMTAREYREIMNLPVSRGIVPRWYRELKGAAAKDNGTYLNLLKGSETRYKKGSVEAKPPVNKEASYWKDGICPTCGGELTGEPDTFTDYEGEIGIVWKPYCDHCKSFIDLSNTVEATPSTP